MSARHGNDVQIAAAGLNIVAAWPVATDSTVTFGRPHDGSGATGTR